MARPRKPSKVLELSGAFNKDPQRKRNKEPIPTGELGPPPEALTEVQKAAWYELSGACFWATETDRQIMEVAVVLLCKFRVDSDMKQMNHLLSALGKLGLTPSDRSKVAVQDKAETKSRWAK